MSNGAWRSPAPWSAFGPAHYGPDEPHREPDPSTSVGIMRLLDRINRQGTTVVMATHDDRVVDQMRKRVTERKLQGRRGRARPGPRRRLGPLKEEEL